MPEIIPTGSVITEAMITDWMSRFSRTRSQAIADLDDIENGRQELPSGLSSTYNALVSAYAGAVEKNRGSGNPPRPSTLAAVVAAAAAVASLVFGAITVTSVQSNSFVRGPSLQATSTADSAIQSAGGIMASSTIESLGTVTSTNLSVSNVATSTYFRAGTDGTFAVPAIGWLTGEGLTKAGAGTLALTGGGQFLMSLSPAAASPYVSIVPAQTNLSLGSALFPWKEFYNGTSTIVRALIGTEAMADLYEHPPLNINYTPTQLQASNNAASILIRAASSTLFSGIEFKNAAFDGDVGAIKAYNESHPGMDGVNLANKVSIESTSGTIMLVGDGGVALMDESGVFRPVSGLGFGGGFAGLNSSASTTISDGNSVIATLDFPAVSANTCSTPLPITLPGLNASDTVMLAGAGMGTLHNLAGVSDIIAYASTTDTVGVKVCNVTASPSSDLPAVQFRASYLRFE